MLMQMHGKKGLNGDGRLLRWFLVPLLPKPRFELEREQLMADRQVAWDEKWRAENAQTRAERRADDLDIALRHAQEALAHAEQRRQNAVAAATRRARKQQQRSVDNCPAHTPR